MVTFDQFNGSFLNNNTKKSDLVLKKHFLVLSSMLEGFLNDHVTLKTISNDSVNLAFPSQE